MEKNLNKMLAERILEKIPSNIKPVEYLMGTLGLARESVYRRKRGELSFSFKEIVKLSKELNFSIDEVIEKDSKDKVIFNIRNNALYNPEETFMAMLREYLNFVRKNFEARQTEMIITQNRVIPIYALNSRYLFKFFYYKWMHQGYQVPLNFYYADVVVPAEILALKDRLISYINQLSNYTFIIDPLTYKNTFDEILYYYERSLITKEELLILKDSFQSLLKHTESLVQRGVNDFGGTYQFYLSSLNIESNTIYAKYDGMVESFLWLYHVNPINTNDKYMCATHKKWLDSMRRCSSLITHSNEILQAKFYNEQYKYLENSVKLISG
ncbi:MAG: hypothetical protein LBF62_03235 [Tannerellaceae bacterium]|jgi:hypothetical protein|nr:hypothetical protein [Tannerellaceae bacterium]